jgi:hypothetical protein
MLRILNKIKLILDLKQDSDPDPKKIILDALPPRFTE